MKLEAGKKYKCRNGYEPILEDFKRGSGYVCRFKIPNGENIYASETGKIFISTQIESEWDIVEEIKEETMKLDHYEDADAFALALLSKKQKTAEEFAEKLRQSMKQNGIPEEEINRHITQPINKMENQKIKAEILANITPLFVPTVEAQRQATEELNERLKKLREKPSALDTQEGGGNYYSKMKIQPVEFIMANGIGFIEGCCIKYVSRWKSKNGIQDLKKARHFLDILIENEEKKLDK